MSERPSFAEQVRVACHDVRTPLATVYGFGRTLERLGERGERANRSLALLLEGAEEVGRLLDALGMLARLELSEVTPRPEAADLGQICAMAAADARDHFSGGRMLAFERDPDPAPLQTDPPLLRQALTWLFEGAARSIPENSALRVREHPGLVRVEADVRPDRDLRLLAARALLELLGASLSLDGGAVELRLT